jgi:hypothetical protein
MTEMARGACLCGMVRFTATLPSNWVAHCHCSRCQRAHGAAFVTWVGMDASRIHVDDAEAALRWFSGGEGERGFCAICGSTLFFRAPAWPGELHVARALFTDPVDRAPQLHAYYDSHVDWAAVSDGLPTRPDPAGDVP